MSAVSPSSSSLALNTLGGSHTGLRDRQIEALKAMFNLNAPVKSSALSASSLAATGANATAAAADPVWKVLVYDRIGQEIISPLLKVSDLRELGITLHLSLHTDRDAIADVTAIYFVMPTKENIERIARDCRDGLYDSFHLNFVSSLPRALLEELASLVVQYSAASKISRVFDQHLNFLCLEKDMFVVKSQDKERISYFALNNPEARDSDIEAAMDEIVDELFSVLVTTNTIPVIRAQRGNASEMVAERLDTRLKDHLKNKRSSLFTEPSVGTAALQRPVLILLDRNMDLTSVVQHTWTYECLVHDLLDFRANRVTVPQAAATSTSGGAAGPVKTKTYDLDMADAFWANNRASPFPTVAVEVENSLNAYKAQIDDITKLSTSMGLTGAGAGNEDAMAALQGAVASHNQFGDASTMQRLNMAVASLPELLEKKALIEIHTIIATALLDSIKARQIDYFFDLEERIMNKTTLDRSLIDILKDGSVGTGEDKLRLLLVYYLSSSDLRDSDLPEFEQALQASGVSLGALAFVKRLRSFNRMTSMPQSSGGSGGVLSRMTFNKVLEHGSELFKQGVKNLLPSKKTLPVTRVVESIMEAKSAADDYRLFDPKAVGSAVKPKSTFQEAIVFVVGGGTYLEYHNLQEYAKKQATLPKRITYGSTELLNAKQFLFQLDSLGSKMN